MAGEWKTYSIDQLKADSPASIAIGPFGSRMKSDNYVASGVPVIRGNNISETKEFVDDFVYITPEFADQLKSQNVAEGDLVFPHRGNIGTVGIVGKGQPRYVLSTSLMKLTCNRLLAEPQFLFYFFRSSIGHHQLMQHASTVGTPGIGSPLASLRSIEVNLPPLPEQQAIARILGALDDKIELNRRRNRTLEAMARAIFQSWFVDFDPVRAKAEGRAPVGVSKELAALFPGSFEESALGPIPKAWRASRWGDIATLEYGKSLRDYAEADGPYRVFGTNGPIGWHTESLCDGPGVVIGRKGAYRGIHYSPKPFFVIDTGFYLKAKAPIDMKWAYYELQKCDINGMDSGSAIPSTSRADFYAIPVCFPSSEVLRAFGRLIQPIYDRKDAGEGESETLAALRDALLPKLISGELRVPDAERIAGRAV